MSELKKVFVKLISLFILNKQKRKDFRYKYISLGNKKSHIKNTGCNNHIDISENKNIRLTVAGDNNSIIIKKQPSSNEEIKIAIYGDNCKIVMEENITVGSELRIIMGQNHPNFGKCNNAELKIGENTSFGEVFITIFNSNAKLHIGKDCMFAWGIELYHTDAHPVLDKTTGEIINKVKTMAIGDNCWIGSHCCIMKNVHLPNNTIVGKHSLVSKSFSEEYTAIGGNPAKVIKQNVTWATRADGYIENEF